MKILPAIGFTFVARTLVAAPVPAAGLRPQYDELHPSFLEQHGWLVAISGLVAIGLLAALIFVLRRGKNKLVEPPDVAARRALKAMLGRAEDGKLIMEASRILRRYAIFACDLPPEELTTGELRRAFQSLPNLSPSLADEIVDFLRQCDEQKFAPLELPPKAGIVPRALELVEKLYRHQQQVLLVAQSQTPKASASPSAA